jgi:hypothetical protein
MIQKNRIGAGALISRPDVFPSRAAMLEEGAAGHIQLMMIPLDTDEFQKNIEIVEPYAGKIRVHAPHHKQNINPCAPGLFLDPKSAGNFIENAMNQTCEAADRTGSDIIVLHAGGYIPGNREEAIRTFHEFLDLYPDDRYILESLPILINEPLFLGVTPDELRTVGDGRINGFCADFPHLWCSSITHEIPYEDMLADMDKLPIRFSHLSGTPGPTLGRQHLLFTDPQNRFNLDLIIPFLMDHPNLEISLEFPHDDPAIIRSQIEIVSNL